MRDTKRPEFGVITLIFARDASAPGGLRLTHWVALDSQNHRTTVRLANQRYGVAVADSAFTFRDPRAIVPSPGLNGSATSCGIRATPALPDVHRRAIETGVIFNLRDDTRRVSPC